uniref:Uncharacterized protein n=1 Tax=uncultured marine virus TaxID=186617 RepID=A0A0F7L669_9VIRU|nr:hypothetical protein [uncultured marine virus]
MTKKYCIKEFRNKHTGNMFFRIYWCRRFLTPWISYKQHYMGGVYSILEFKNFDDADKELNEIINKDKAATGNEYIDIFRRS